MIGRTYEVCVDGKPIGLVGSTIKSLAKRRIGGYTKRFGPTVELCLIREIPCPEGYSDSDYNFYLKACEALDIVRKNTYVPHGLNKISPLIQALAGRPLEIEMGRLGMQGAKEKFAKWNHSAANREHLKRIRTTEHQREAGKAAGQVAIAIGSIYRAPTFEGRSRGGKTSGRNNVKSGHMARLHSIGGKAGGRKGILAVNRKLGSEGIRARALKGACTLHRIKKNRPCNCGQHNEFELSQPA